MKPAVMDPPRITQLRRTLAVVLAGSIVSAIGGWAIWSAGQRAVHRALGAQATLHAKIMEARFSDLEHPVLSAADFVAADRDGSPASFLRFASFAAPHAPLLRWLGWAPLVNAADRAAFEALARRQYKSFRIVAPSGGTLAAVPLRARYFPLYAVRNFRGREVPLGLDLAANPVLRAAADRARDAGRPIATGPIPSLDARRSSTITVLFAPIYRNGIEALGGIAARRRNLIGYIVAAYGIESMLGLVTAGVPTDHERISFARSVSAQPTHFGQAVAAGQPAIAASAGPPLPAALPGEYRVVRQLHFSGQIWIATFVFMPRVSAWRQSGAPFGWFGAGLLLTAALGTMTARGESQRLATERLVGARTRELSAANGQLRESADMLEATVAAAPLGIIVVDPTGQITQWNRGAERIFGYAAADVIGRNYFALVVPQPDRTVADGLFQRICEGEPLRDIAVQRLRRDGALLDIRASGNPLHDAEDRLRGVVLANQDVTESRKLEEQLRQAQKMEAIGQLTGGVAHDFNNLLGTAITSLDMLRDRVQGDAESGELASDALDALLHGADLVRRLLAFARRQPLQPEQVRLNGLVLEVVRLLRPLLDDSVEIHLELGEALWSVLVDRAQFETTLINLSTNARDAMALGGRLGIATRNLHLAAETPLRNPDMVAGDYVVVEVSDTGTGMSPALVQRIFEPFFTTKGKSVGTGLGLSMVLGFIKQSGGHIEVESEPGRGSCFRLYLSRHVEDPVPDLLAEPVAASPAVAASRGERVLVVEDNLGLRHIVLQQLKKLGYRVLQAEDAPAAIAVLEGNASVDLLFTDVMLPGGMNGIELADLVRVRWPQTKLLLTSGFPEVLLEEPKSLGGLRLISKPYREDELARTLREVLAG